MAKIVAFRNRKIHTSHSQNNLTPLPIYTRHHPAHYSTHKIKHQQQLKNNISSPHILSLGPLILFLARAHLLASCSYIYIYALVEGDGGGARASSVRCFAAGERARVAGAGGGARAVQAGQHAR